MKLSDEGTRLVLKAEDSAVDIWQPIVSIVFPAAGIFALVRVVSATDFAGKGLCFDTLFPVIFFVLWIMLALRFTVQYWGEKLFFLILDGEGIHRKALLPVFPTATIPWSELYGWGVEERCTRDYRNNHRIYTPVLFFTGHSRKERGNDSRTVSKTLRLSAAKALHRDYEIITAYCSRYTRISPDGISL